MDMKKLKSAVWKCVAEKPGAMENVIIYYFFICFFWFLIFLQGQPDDSSVEVKPKMFSEVYKQLPNHMNDKMKSELSCSLAFAALLHLANEHNLELTGQSDLKDVHIEKAQKPT